MDLHAIVLELPDDLIEPPDLIVESTPDAATRALVRLFAVYDKNLNGGLAGFCEDDGEWLRDNPVPAWDGDADLTLWLTDLHEWLIGFYWTHYTIKIDANFGVIGVSQS